MKTCAFLFCMLLLTNFLYAQDPIYSEPNIIDEIQNDTGIGSVNIYQDSSIYRMVQRDILINGKFDGIADGYRIQIISVSGRNAREESQLAKIQFMSEFPEFDPNQIYSVYQPPFFKVRVGNYRNKFEALKFYKKVMKTFPNAYLVKGQIEYPVIE